MGKTKSYRDFQAAKKAKKVGKKPKDQNAPKRPLSAYMLFSADNRDEVTEEVGSASDVTVIAKKLGQRWANASEDDKAEYQAQAADLKVDYEEGLAKYKKSKKYADYQETLTAWKLSNKQTAKTCKGCPQTPLNTSACTPPCPPGFHP